MRFHEFSIDGRRVVGGQGAGEAIVSGQGISFFGGVDPKTGIVTEHGHQLRGETIRGKVLVFPRGKGSTVGSYVIYGLRKNNAAPVAILNIETEPIIIAGCVLGGIPLVDRPSKNPIEFIKTGDWVHVDADVGRVLVRKRCPS
jgi:predicted aconitase with swiveling domain